MLMRFQVLSTCHADVKERYSICIKNKYTYVNKNFHKLLSNWRTVWHDDQELERHSNENNENFTELPLSKTLRIPAKTFL